MTKLCIFEGENSLKHVGLLIDDENIYSQQYYDILDQYGNINKVIGYKISNAKQEDIIKFKNIFASMYIAYTKGENLSNFKLDLLKNGISISEKESFLLMKNMLKVKNLPFNVQRNLSNIIINIQIPPNLNNLKEPEICKELKINPILSDFTKIENIGIMKLERKEEKTSIQTYKSFRYILIIDKNIDNKKLLNYEYSKLIASIINKYILN